jgi:hypothetical protein
MKVNIQDVLFWMDAIRNSDDTYRTLESFWKGQVNSKIWLIETLKEHTCPTKNKIVIHGGWNGVLASLLFNSDINIDSITSVDIDPTCEEIARTMNMQQVMEGRFTAVTADMTEYDYYADIVINTSCEHITQEQYEQWLDRVPPLATIVLQSNDYFDLNEHIRCASNIDEFLVQSKIRPLFRGEFETPKYNRFMIIGRKK